MFKKWPVKDKKLKALLTGDFSKLDFQEKAFMICNGILIIDHMVVAKKVKALTTFLVDMGLLVKCGPEFREYKYRPPQRTCNQNLLTTLKIIDCFFEALKVEDFIEEKETKGKKENDPTKK